MVDRIAVVNSVVSDFTGEKFSWGELDCCLFAAEVASRLTGVDYAESFSYDSKAGADEIIEEHGGLYELLVDLLGEPTDKPPRPGDVVLLAHEEPTVGVWYMRSPIAKSPRRFVECTPSDVTHVWRIG